MSRYEEITTGYKDIFFHISQGAYPRRHNHNGYWEFMFVSHDNITHNINSKHISLPENSLCLVRPNDTHSIDANPTAVRMVLGVRSEYIKNFLTSFSPDTYDTALSLPMPPTTTVSDEKSAEISKIKNLILLSSEETRYKTLQLLFFTFMQEILFFDIKNNQTTVQHSKPVSTLLQLISNSSNLALSMPALIEKTTYSYSHINRIFLKEIGVTLSDYLRQKRIDHAQNLLINTDKSLKEIAYCVGYNNYSNFSLFFESKTGKTPGEYRKLYSGSFRNE